MKDLVEKIKNSNIALIIQYGSRSRGEGRLNSDEDFAVVVKNDYKSEKDRIKGICEEHSEVSIYTHTLEEIKRGNVSTPMNSRFHSRSLLKQGKILYHDVENDSIVVPRLGLDDALDNLSFHRGVVFSYMHSDNEKSVKKGFMYALGDIYTIEEKEITKSYEEIYRYFMESELVDERKKELVEKTYKSLYYQNSPFTIGEVQEMLELISKYQKEIEYSSENLIKKERLDLK